MLCPICKKALQEQKIATAKSAIHQCPMGHGILLSGGLLGEAKDLNYKEFTDTNITRDSVTKGEVICPHCNSPMVHVNFNDTEIFIDACPSSPLRWLDSGELRKIKEYEPDLSKADAQALLRQIALAPTLDEAAFQKQVNPSINILPVTHGRNLGGLALIVGIRALFHSKYTRFFLLVILLIIALFYTLVLKEF